MKRTELKRTGFIKRMSADPALPKSGKPRARRSRSITDPPPEVKQAVKERDDWHCRACGGHVGLLGAVHHRKLRSQGGTNDLANLLYLHHTCHTEVVHRNPAMAYELGFMVRSTDNPTEMPCDSYWPEARS